jgi:ATP-binding cassette, subfamily B (MDR/TAP), member 1
VQWKFTLVIICILPLILGVLTVSIKFISKYEKEASKELASAATVAEEILSNVRTVQAYGNQDKLAQLYDKNLVALQRIKYKTRAVSALMIGTMFFVVYASYALGFCTIQKLALSNLQGKVPV